MTSLLKVNLGTPPKAEDGDTSRDANTKANSNVDVLNAQATLTSAPAVITAAQALTAGAHIGKRVNINLAAAGVINLPAAATCAADQVTLLRNLGTTVVTLDVTAASGDTVSLSKLNSGESALLDTDGVHTWTVLMRGRTNSDNETVSGNSAVGGNETIGGTLSVTGASSFGSTGQAGISSAGAYSGPGATYTGNVAVGGTLGVTGQAAFALRPTFAGNTPWDSGNLQAPMSSIGMTSGATPVPGYIGESRQASQPAGGLSAGVAAIVVSLALPPGNWMVWTTGDFRVGSGTATDFTLGISTSAAFGGLGTYASLVAPATANTVSSPPVFLNLSATTTYSAVARCNAGSSINCTLFARRVL